MRPATDPDRRHAAPIECNEGFATGYPGRSVSPDAVEDRMWYNLVSGGKRSVNREQGSGTTEKGNEMETGTSCFTKFDVQRNMLAEYLVSLCGPRRTVPLVADQHVNQGWLRTGELSLIPIFVTVRPAAVRHGCG